MNEQPKLPQGDKPDEVEVIAARRFLKAAGIVRDPRMDYACALYARAIRRANQEQWLNKASYQPAQAAAEKAAEDFLDVAEKDPSTIRDLWSTEPKLMQRLLDRFRAAAPLPKAEAPTPEDFVAARMSCPNCAEQSRKRIDVLLDDNCIATIKRLTPEGGEEISFGGVIGGIRLKWNQKLNEPKEEHHDPTTQSNP